MEKAQKLSLPSKKDNLQKRLKVNAFSKFVKPHDESAAESFKIIFNKIQANIRSRFKNLEKIEGIETYQQQKMEKSEIDPSIDLYKEKHILFDRKVQERRRSIRQFRKSVLHKMPPDAGNIGMEYFK